MSWIAEIKHESCWSDYLVILIIHLHWLLDSLGGIKHVPRTQVLAKYTRLFKDSDSLAKLEVIKQD
jgi:hypothetical protein